MCSSDYSIIYRNSQTIATHADTVQVANNIQPLTFSLKEASPINSLQKQMTAYQSFDYILSFPSPLSFLYNICRT